MTDAPQATALTGLAPGSPGIAPRWTSSVKSGLGTSLGPGSRVWFTLSHVILNEVYYPRADQACLRDLGLIITDGRTFFSEEKRDTTTDTTWIAPGVPAFRTLNTCRSGRYHIEKEILTDPARDVVLAQVRFVPLKGALADYHVYALAAPHLANHGAGNTAFVGDYKGVPMLFAERNATSLALACAPAWSGMSVGFVGASDGWQELRQHRQLVSRYARAEDGNVALTGEVDLTACGGSFVVALRFGASPTEAGHPPPPNPLFGVAPRSDAERSEMGGGVDPRQSQPGVRARY